MKYVHRTLTVVYNTTSKVFIHRYNGRVITNIESIELSLPCQCAHQDLVLISLKIVTRKIHQEQHTANKLQGEIIFEIINTIPIYDQVIVTIAKNSHKNGCCYSSVTKCKAVFTKIFLLSNFFF